MNNTIVGVDLAKHVIQVCIVKQNQVVSNDEMTTQQFMLWLLNSKPITIVFEACATSNYWKREAEKLGHQAKLVSARLVASIRQNQKTDKNDALAVAQASQLVDVNFINGKTFEQQELQSIMRMRDLAIKQKQALNQQIQSLLLEFNIKTSFKKGGLSGVVQQVLEDADNGFAFEFRHALDAAWRAYLCLSDSVATYDKTLEAIIKKHPDCEKLLALEGVGIIGAINLYIAIGSNDIGVFKTGRSAAACLGLTPIQHSSGGKTNLGSISKQIRHSSLRSCLINGAMSMVILIERRDPRTEKERWLKQLIQRRGRLCAAVALANKTVRTAFAMLTQNTNYVAQPLKG